MNRILKNILLIVLILAVISNSLIHYSEILETRLNTIQSITNKNLIFFSNELTWGELGKHFGLIFGLLKRVNKLEKEKLVVINKIEEQIPDFEKLMNATVIVYEENFFRGAGVCVKEDEKYYYILSAQHLVVSKQKNNVISIKLLNGIICAGEVIKEDFQMDLSLIRIIKSIETNLNIVKISENNPKIGETVYAIGHPRRNEFVLTKGIVSNTSYLDITISNITVIYGNSGGGLFNTKGELLGINVNVLHYYLTIGKDKKGKEIEIPVPEFSLSGAVNLEIIKEFLK